jgi:hypothetical protein
MSRHPIIKKASNPLLKVNRAKIGDNPLNWGVAERVVKLKDLAP